MIQLTLYLCCFLGAFVVAESCTSPDYSSYIYKGYQSSYPDVRGRQEYPDVPGCDPIQVWAMVRHGTRNPHIGSATRMSKYLTTMKKEIVRAHHAGKGHLCPGDVARLQEWSFDKTLMSEAKYLTKAGYNELVQVGRGLRSHFPVLFDGAFDPDRYYFAYSNNQRNVLSCDAFGKGLVGSGFNATRDGHYDYLPEVGCRVTAAIRTEKYPSSQPQVEAFFKSARIHDKVSKHYAYLTGLKERLTEGQVDTLFEACHYETAKYLKPSPWCSLFNPDDLHLMVYSEMLLHYYEFSYGHKLSKDFGCLQVKGLVDTFNTTINKGLVSYILKSYVSHDLVMEMFFTALGCFRDPELLTTDYSRMTQTKYNNSANFPFAANFVAVLYSCVDGDYKIQFYLNERPMGCCMSDNNDPCPWTIFEEKTRRFTETCIEDVCDETDSAASNRPAIIYFISVLLIVLSIY